MLAYPDAPGERMAFRQWSRPALILGNTRTPLHVPTTSVDGMSLSQKKSKLPLRRQIRQVGGCTMILTLGGLLLPDSIRCPTHSPRSQERRKIPHPGLPHMRMGQNRLRACTAALASRNIRMEPFDYRSRPGPPIERRRYAKPDLQPHPCSGRRLPPECGRMPRKSTAAVHAR